MLTEAQRHQLYNELTQVLSTEGAAALMEVVGSVTIAELATKSDIRDLRLAAQSDIRDVRSELGAVRSELKTEIAEFRAEVETEFAEFRAEVKTEFAEFRAEVKTEFAEVRTEMAELKHDLTRTFATMLFVSQGVLVSIVGLLVHFA